MYNLDPFEGHGLTTATVSLSDFGALRSEQCVVERNVDREAKNPNDQANSALWSFHEIVWFVIVLGLVIAVSLQQIKSVIHGPFTISSKTQVFNFCQRCKHTTWCIFAASENYEAYWCRRASSSSSSSTSSIEAPRLSSCVMMA